MVLVKRRRVLHAREDFARVGVLGGAPVAFVVSPSMPRSLKTVRIAARVHPGKYNDGSPGAGTRFHLAAGRLKQLTGAPIGPVPYNGSGPALQDLFGGSSDEP